MTRRSRRLAGQSPEIFISQNLCSKCLSIQPDKYESNRDSRDRNLHPEGLLIRRTVGEIINGTQSGCPGCLFTCLVLFQRPPTPADLANPPFSAEFLGTDVDMKQEAYARIRIHCEKIRLPLGWGEFDVCDVTGMERTPKLILEGLGECYQKRDWQGFGGTIARIPRLVCPNPVSPEGTTIVAEWLKLCSDHRSCLSLEDRPMPTRVIDVEDYQAPKLCHPGSRKGQYIILSHCWGPESPMRKTTMTLLAQHQKLIEPASLPANFRDAITFTHELGFRYLWIDALCIVQDSPDDWTYEASKMAEYYNNSALMISASASPSCESGFLGVRNMPKSPVFGNHNQFCLRPALTAKYKFASLPISRRAWTLQERYLAPRVLHFLEDQMYFECGSDEYFEGYLKNNPSETLFVTKYRIQWIIERELHLKIKRLRNPEAKDWYYTNHEFQLRLWYDFVEDFTSRDITFQSDKLPALAGMASRFAHPKMGEYMTGLWELDLFRGLCWKIVIPKAEKLPGTLILELQERYTAPSWSWAAIKFAVGFEKGLWWPQKGASRSQSDEYYHWEKQYGPRLAKTHLLPSHSNPYFPVLDGSYIEMEGYTRPIFLTTTLIDGVDTIGPGGTVLKEVHLDASSTTDVYCYFDLPADGNAPCRALMILQICKDRSEDRNVHALLLEEQPDGSFRRVGVVRLGNYNLLSSTVEVRRSADIRWGFHMHPRELDGKMHELKNEEWEACKWSKRTLRLI